MKHQLNVRISNATRKKLEKLARYHGTKTEVITVALNELYRKELHEMNTDLWSRYMGDYITPEEYENRDLKEIQSDLTDLWGDPSQGNDYVTPSEIQRIAKELKTYLDSLNPS